MIGSTITHHRSARPSLPPEEIQEIRRSDEYRDFKRLLDKSGGEITVVEQIHELQTGEVVAGPPKTDASLRTVAMPEALKKSSYCRMRCARAAAASPQGAMQ